MAKKIVGATLGHCVHVAGILNFLRLAEACGYQTTFLGIGCREQDLIGALREEDRNIWPSVTGLRPKWPGNFLLL